MSAHQMDKRQGFGWVLRSGRRSRIWSSPLAALFFIVGGLILDRVDEAGGMAAANHQV